MRAGGRKRAKGPGRPARAPGPISTPPASPGAPREAELARLQDLLARAPEDTRVLNNLAVTLRALGRRDEATRHLERARALNPDDPDINHNLGNALGDAGRDEDAILAYRRSLAARPGATRTSIQLAATLQRLGRKAEALRVTSDALAFAPADAELRNAHGALLYELKRPEAALAHLDLALRLSPSLRAARANAGLAANALGLHARIVASAREVLAREPDCPATHAQLGQALISLGQIEEARPHVEAALAAAPDDLEALMARSRLLFLAGEWEAAWPAYSVRWRRADNPPPRTRLPRWQGEPAGDLSIFVHAEQGLGDSINFCRYLVPLAARARHVRFGCQEPLVGLLRASLPGIEVVPHPEGPGSCTHIVPLLDLPMRLGMHAPWWPGAPYLRAEGPPPLALPDDGRLAVGIAWAGNPDHGNDRFRSIAAEQLLFLAGNPRARVVSLQRQVPDSLLERIDAAGLMLDAGSRLFSFADSAAMLARLDLVVAVDTSIAHLAGAMGKPVWMLLPAAPDWRWGIAGSATPWYPTMRVFRQREHGDWSAPLAELAKAFEALGAQGKATNA
jgi:tetratricopeptide (TPR) repeat protein